MKTKRATWLDVIQEESFFNPAQRSIEKEVASLRKNKKFMEFLDARGRETETLSLEEVKQRLNM